MSTIQMYAIKQISDLTLSFAESFGNRKDQYISDGSGKIHRLTADWTMVKLFSQSVEARTLIAKIMKNLRGGEAVSGSIDLQVVPVTISL